MLKSYTTVAAPAAWESARSSTDKIGKKDKEIAILLGTG